MANSSKSPVHSFNGTGWHSGAIVAVSLAPINQLMMGRRRSFGGRRISGLEVEAGTTVEELQRLVSPQHLLHPGQ